MVGESMSALIVFRLARYPFTDVAVNPDHVVSIRSAEMASPGEFSEIVMVNGVKAVVCGGVRGITEALNGGDHGCD